MISRKTTGIGLAIVLVLSGWLRFSGLNWDEGQHLHPDERFLTMVGTSLKIPRSLSEYFDTAKSPLNPRNKGYSVFVYGTFPVSLVRFVGEAVNRCDYGRIVLTGRFLSAAADWMTVFVCFLLGLRLLKSRIGALASAALYGFTVLAIQHAHFMVVDSFTTLFVSLALLSLTEAQRRSSLLRWGIAGAFWGLALSCKLSVYTFLVAPVLLALWQSWAPGRGLRNENEPFSQALERAALRVLVFCGVAFLFFRIASPDAFRGPGFFGIIPEDRWIASIKEARRLVSGEVDFPPGHQWTDRPRYWFPFKNMVLWGMGPMMGIAAWGGLVWVLSRLVRGRDQRLLLPAVWMFVLFFHQGGQWVKCIRYFLPLYPAASVLAGWFVIELHRASTVPWRRRGAVALSGVILGGTFLWALAFTNIYRTPNSRVAASRWFLSNIPKGSVVGNEHWDDPLPLRVDGHDPFRGEYRGVDLQWYGEDEESKRVKALEWLDQVDVLVLSSNRLYDSIPRLWMRFPMTTRYYQALFSGELGFQRVVEFTSYPRLLGLEFPDQTAEEAFSVYDHARVQIFRKTPDYSHEKAAAILGGVNLETVLRLTPLQESRAPGGLRFPPDKWTRIQRDSSNIPSRPENSPWGVPAVWIFWLLLLGPLTAPILFTLAPTLPDRGWSLSRPIGLLLVVGGAWIFASLNIAAFSSGLLIGVLGAMLFVSGTLAILHRKEWYSFLRVRWTLLVSSELLFWISFAVFVLIRWLNPDLWHPSLGGEKPMDVAYLTAATRIQTFPPYNPWCAGSTMNYYYFGFVQTAALIKLSGAAIEVGYNLAIASFYALFVSAIFGAGMGITGGKTTVVEKRPSGNRRLVLMGILAVFLAAAAGNLAEISVIWRHVTTSHVRPESWFWDATRVIHHPVTEAGPITEFPFFSFLFADLHPHLMALPLFGAMLALVCAIAHDSRMRWGLLTLTAAILGGLWITNPWDFPTGAALLLGGLALHTFGAIRSPQEAIGSPLSSIRSPRKAIGSPPNLIRSPWGANMSPPSSIESSSEAIGSPQGAIGSAPGAIGSFSGLMQTASGSSSSRWLRTAVCWGGVIVAARLLYWPFHDRFGSAYGTFELWHGSRTPLGDYLLINGVFLLLLLTGLWTDLMTGARLHPLLVLVRMLVHRWKRPGLGADCIRRLRRRCRPRSGIWYSAAAGGVALLMVGICLLTGLYLPALLLVLLTWTVLALSRRRVDVKRQIPLGLAAAALGIGLGVEFVTLRGDIGRMNTMFKFYLQTWNLFVLSSVAFVFWMGDYARSIGRKAIWSWRILLTVIGAAVLVYPVFAIPARIQNRFTPGSSHGLDGLAFMQTSVLDQGGKKIELRYDLEAIRWIRTNISGAPVIAEATTHPQLYGWGARFATYTGLPAIIGWDWHERQQLAALPKDVVMSRVEDVKRLYTTTDPSETWRLLHRYGAELVVVGGLEKALFPAAAIDKFASGNGKWWDKIYENGGATIYRVAPKLPVVNASTR